jgi:hypothetical protein
MVNGWGSGGDKEEIWTIGNKDLINHTKAWSPLQL